MIEWLEGFLQRGNKSILMVTHDRYFLDRVCDVILELDDHTIYTYRGNYAYYLEKRQERIDNRRAEQARAANLYRTELEWMRRMPQARGHKAKYREDAFYELEARAHQRIEERQVRLKASNVYIGSKIFECQYVSKRFGKDKVILDNFYYNFARFEKMGIVGNNGTGKSTFIKRFMETQIIPNIDNVYRKERAKDCSGRTREGLISARPSSSAIIHRTACSLTSKSGSSTLSPSVPSTLTLVAGATSLLPSFCSASSSRPKSSTTMCINSVEDSDANCISVLC